MKSLNELIACKVPRVHFPLMCLINYMGWRVICCSLLPISQKTLVPTLNFSEKFQLFFFSQVYGSADAGKTVLNSSRTMNGIMRELGTEEKIFFFFNLKFFYRAVFKFERTHSEGFAYFWTGRFRFEIFFEFSENFFKYFYRGPQRGRWTVNFFLIKEKF